MHNKFNVTKNVMLAGALLLLLPGCLDWNKSNKKDSGVRAVQDGSAAMFTVDGTTLITEKTFEAYFSNLVATNTNQQFQMMLQLLPNAKEEIFKGRANEELLCYWAEKEGITSSKEYQDKYEQGMRLVQVGLAAEFFQRDFASDLDVTEAEMRAYYEAHKDPELLVAPAGFKALGLECGSKEQAQSVYAQAKQNPRQFKSIAGAKVKNLEINDFSNVDGAIKNAVATVTSFPAVLNVQATDGKLWVVVVTSKEEAKYHSYDQVKQGLQQMVKQEKMAKFYMERLNILKEKYNVVENVSSLTAAASVEAENFDEQLAQALEQDNNGNEPVLSDAQLQEALENVAQSQA